MTALANAVEELNHKIVQYLIEKGSNKETTDNVNICLIFFV